MPTAIRVLMVEDNPMDAELICATLLSAGFEPSTKLVQTEDEYIEALGQTLKSEFDIILSDYSLPQFNGLQALKILKEKGFDIPFILISGVIGEELAVAIMKQGASDYLLKDRMARLGEAVNHALEEKKLRHAKQQAEEELREKEERFRSAFNDAATGMALISADGHFLEVNPAICTMYNYSQDELLMITFQELIVPEDLEFLQIQVNRLLQSEIPAFQLEVRGHSKSGDMVWSVLSASAVPDINKNPLYLVFQFQNITPQKNAENSLVHLSRHDHLTGFVNRIALEDETAYILEYAKRKKERVAVLFLDLDRFGQINETFGYEVGDQFLRAVAQRLKSCFRGEDIISRFGGDNFIIILPEITQIEYIINITQKLLHTLSQPFNIDGREFLLTASIGISIYPENGEETATLLQNAETALNKAKVEGGNIYQFCTPEMAERVQAKMNLEQTLRHAITAQEFMLYYQPKIDVRSGKVSGVEALIRWKQADGSMIPPNDFIPLAEETGLIVPIGEWVFRTACKQLKVWHDEDLFPLEMSINLSIRQFREADDLLRMAKNIITEINLDPRYVILEITESLLSKDLAKTLFALNSLKELGFSLAIDDFGTGYSSLSYLKRFSIDWLKIDQSFVKDISTDPNDAALVMAIIAIAQSLEIGIVAEGVETKEQLDFLIQHQCEIIQGYYFSRPLPAEGATKFIKNWEGFSCNITTPSLAEVKERVPLREKGDHHTSLLNKCF